MANLEFEHSNKKTNLELRTYVINLKNV